MNEPPILHTQRKKEHIRVCLEEDVVHPRVSTGFERLRLRYMSLPEVDLKSLDISVEMLGKRLSMPFMILGMTGGAELSKTINRNLALAAQECRVALGLGSMRVALEEPEAMESFRVRYLCPDVPLWANLGAAQLNNGYGVRECMKIVEVAEADGLCLHVNALQEVAQRDGNVGWAGLIDKIAAVSEALPVPVILKEVGFGFSGEVAQRLNPIPVWGIDTGGAGGTSWLEVEKRVWGREDLDIFDELGIPTARSIQEVRKACPQKVVIGSGGVRTGVDAVKALALGADLTGAALPLLAPAVESPGAVVRWLEKFREEMRVAAFACGAGDYAGLKRLQLDTEN